MGLYGGCVWPSVSESSECLLEQEGCRIGGVKILQAFCGLFGHLEPRGQLGKQFVPGGQA